MALLRSIEIESCKFVVVPAGELYFRMLSSITALQNDRAALSV